MADELYEFMEYYSSLSTCLSRMCKWRMWNVVVICMSFKCMNVIVGECDPLILSYIQNIANCVSFGDSCIGPFLINCWVHQRYCSWIEVFTNPLGNWQKNEMRKWAIFLHVASWAMNKNLIDKTCFQPHFL